MPRKAIDVRVLEAASRVIKTLGHPMRLRIVELLEPGEKSVTELVEALRTPQAIVSQQLVKLRRNGVNVYYRISNRRVVKILACVRGCSVKDFA